MSKKKIVFNLAILATVLVAFYFIQSLDLNKKQISNSIPEFSTTVYSNQNQIKSDNVGVTLLTKNTLSKRAAFVNFWATWCESCESEKEYVNELWNEFKDSKTVNFLSIVTQDNLKDFESSKKTKEVAMPLVFDAKNKLQAAFSVNAIPTTFLVDSNGSICRKIESAITKETKSILLKDLKVLESGGSCKLLEQHSALLAAMPVSQQAESTNFAKKKTAKKSSEFPVSVPEFSLINSNNEVFTQADLKGKVWIADFIFTSCGSACPVLTRKMKKLRADFKNEKDLNFLSFTVDPETDTPYVLKEYAKSNNINTNSWTFLTGKWDVIKDLLTNGFRVTGADEPVFHTDRFVLIDSNLKIRGFYSTGTKHQVTKLKKDLLYLLNE